jgi:flagellar biosynthesis component FlhA
MDTPNPVVPLLNVGRILIALIIPVPPLLLLAASLSLAVLTLAWARACWARSQDFLRFPLLQMIGQVP